MSAEYVTRKRLRNRLLSELYNHYFSTGGTAYHITQSELSKDREVDLAYDYLTQKGLIKAEKRGVENIYMKPTVYGIDTVENDY